eukprot:CAMPEP_0168313568 /NCGR_PEP_ID=MMETSP0210-20121227/2755_1 /TAXON_ID=40633 /ORGANISM="Condylostoma magnum, Strain COL2" /LENGTH=92 /DNA_ID=CAMNT_0008271623 /DNA_START=3020 /DNA_END=3295 /DNA_ORIENTATION=+
MIERLEKRKESLLRENEKLRSDRTSRTRVGMQKRDIPNPIRGMLPTSNVSFEEFSKDRNNENSGTITPNSNVTGDTESSPKPLRQKNFSVIR